MNIIRKIKLNQLGYYQFSDLENELLCLIKETFSDLKKVNLPEYKTSTYFYYKYNIFICRYSESLKYFDVNYEIFWSILELKFQICEMDIINILKYICSIYLNILDVDEIDYITYTIYKQYQNI